ncbi:putative nodulin homeobox protein [Helianthus debilis subsp. tardiflorus]
MCWFSMFESIDGCDAADGFLSDWWGQDPNSPENLLDEDYDPSPFTSQLTHRKDRWRSVSRTKDTVVVPEKRSKFKVARVHSDEENALPEKESGSGPDPNSPENLLEEDYDPSPSTSQLTHRKDRRRSVSRTKDTVVVPEKRSKFKVGQHVILTDDKGQEVGKGTIHLVKGVWSGKNLVESSSYVVDVEELKKSAAQLVSCEIRMLWNSSQLVLIQQQLP